MVASVRNLRKTEQTGKQKTVLVRFVNLKQTLTYMFAECFLVC